MSLFFNILVIISILVPMDRLVILFLYLTITFPSWAYTYGSYLIINGKNYFKISITKYKLYLLSFSSFIFILFAIFLIYFIKEFEVSLIFSFILSGLFIGYLYVFLWVQFIISKLIVSNELDKEAQFSQIATTFIQMMFFPITVWFIQGRIHKIAAKIYAENTQTY